MLGIFVFNHLLLLENAHMPLQDIALVTRVARSIKAEAIVKWSNVSQFIVLYYDKNMLVSGSVML